MGVVKNNSNMKSEKNADPPYPPLIPPWSPPVGGKQGGWKVPLIKGDLGG